MRFTLSGVRRPPTVLKKIELARIEILYTKINIDGSTEILEAEMIETTNQ